MNWLAVFIGGGIGSLLRYGLSLVIKNQSGALPWSTILANIFATSLLAFFIWLASAKYLTPGTPAALFLMVGLCGGFSTFSTFSFETFNLLKAGHTGLAILNIVVSIVLCLIVVFILLRKVELH